ncbi:hypothetical protein ACLKA6_001400 [Drosophila palustris]
MYSLPGPLNGNAWQQFSAPRQFVAISVEVKSNAPSQSTGSRQQATWLQSLPSDVVTNLIACDGIRNTYNTKSRRDATIHLCHLYARVTSEQANDLPNDPADPSRVPAD